MLTSTDATNGIVENMSSSRGFLRKVRDGSNRSIVYYEMLGIDHRGQVTRDRRHNNARLMTRKSYNATTGRIEAISSGALDPATGLGHIQELRYRFDSLGNLLARGDKRPEMNVEERFSYDVLNRLTRASVYNIGSTQTGVVAGSPRETISLSYDQLGNICSKKAVGQANPDHPVNALRSSRAPLEEFVRFHDV